MLTSIVGYAMLNRIREDMRGFAFVKTKQQDALRSAITLVNRERQHAIGYQQIFMTSPRRGWIALVFDGVLIDQYLLRNISRRLETYTFGLSSFRMYISYRLHSNGKTIAAYESHLPLVIMERLRHVLSAGAVDELDLAEPAERVVLQRYHEYQLQGGWVKPSPGAMPPEVESYYAGHAVDLGVVLKQGTDPRYIDEVLKPGYSIETALERLLGACALPYLHGDEISAPVWDEASYSVRMQPLTGLDILDRQRWANAPELPKGWVVVRADAWE